MAKTIVALYKNAQAAQLVVDALLGAGFSGDDISLLVKDANGDLARDFNQNVSGGEGAGFGALVGALVGIGSALVPGIGPLIGTGPIAVAATVGIGAAAGALTGGIAAGLLDLGLNESQAQAYARKLRWSGTIVSLTTNDEWLEWAHKIMARQEPLKIEERQAAWPSGAWGESASGEFRVEAAEVEPYRDSTGKMKRPPEIKRGSRVQVYQRNH